MDTSEISKFKQPATMDELLSAKIHPIMEAINEHVETIYKNFNLALHNQNEIMSKVEKDLSGMVRVLWGIVNSANVRTSALERVLMKSGLDEQELVAEIELVTKELNATGEWKGHDVKDVAGEMGIKIPTKDQPDQAGLIL